MRIFSKRPDVSYPLPEPGAGLPVWFTNVHSLLARRRCRKVGHKQTVCPSCDHCGMRFKGSNEHGGWMSLR